MDKLVKRAGVAVLIVAAAAGSAFALGLIRYAGALHATPAAPAPVAATQTAPVANAQPPYAAALSPQPALAAVGKAPAAAAKKPAFSPKIVDSSPADEAPEPRADDLLDFGPGADEREAKLADRGAKAFGVRQLGGRRRRYPQGLE